MKRVLDLGCGFGFMTEFIAKRVAHDAEMTGVDVFPANEKPYLDAVRSAGRRGRFICAALEQSLDWPDRFFDLVVASYSLYYFRRLLPEIARVLAPSGLFFASAHSTRSCLDMLDSLGLSPAATDLTLLALGFSAENAGDQLREHFEQTVRIDYHNTLLFDGSPEGEADWLAFVRFKLPLLVPACQQESDAAADAVIEKARALLAREGTIILDKSDAGFRCSGARCR
ncbi:MAG: class I SAM-dependent methyltransferase [Acidobacteriota bacterium]|nr:MAG: class I SAM-dependent methyltransferase [Acidobacteriota bacterium]